MGTHTHNGDDAAIEAMLRMGTIAIVGLSSDPAQPSESVGRYLIDRGYRVVPVNPNEREVHGQRAYPDLRSVPEPVELVGVFPPAGGRAGRRAGGDRRRREGGLAAGGDCQRRGGAARP